MAGQNSGESSGNGQPGEGGGSPSPGPDAMLEVWTSWVEAMSGSARWDWASHAKPWWQMAASQVRGITLAGGLAQLDDTLAKDPFLRSVDQMWNANPLRD